MVGEHEPVRVIEIVGDGRAVELRIPLQLLAPEDRVESIHPPAVDREQAGPVPVRDRCRHHVGGGRQRDRRPVQELPHGRPVGARVLPEVVIEGPVLLHDEDHVLDRNARRECRVRGRRRRSAGRRPVRRDAERLLRVAFGRCRHGVERRGWARRRRASAGARDRDHDRDEEHCEDAQGTTTRPRDVGTWRVRRRHAWSMGGDLDHDKERTGRERSRDEACW